MRPYTLGQSLFETSPLVTLQSFFFQTPNVKEPIPLRGSRAIRAFPNPEGKRNIRSLEGFHLAGAFPPWLLLRKEVIQPLVPQRLPCYDFIPITTRTLDGQSARLRV